jgi:hypothetical protein
VKELMRWSGPFSGNRWRLFVQRGLAEDWVATAGFMWGKHECCVWDGEAWIVKSLHDDLESAKQEAERLVLIDAL